MSGTVAYFSMEIGLEPALPTYSGGLGVLAGDTLRSCADLGLPVVGVSLVHRRGYFRQRLGARGRQSERPEPWDPAARLEPLPVQVSVEIEGRSVQVAGWRYDVSGENGGQVPVFLLDTHLSANRPSDRQLTDRLYGGDDRYRLSQEVVLGIGGLRMLRALGYRELERLHLNEGHAALAAIALLEEYGENPPRETKERERRVESVRDRCVFTTHTPVSAGHDRFSATLAREVLGRRRYRWMPALGVRRGLHMTELALATSRFVNGVAMRHGEVSRRMFPGSPIRAITNGIHSPTWASPAFRALFDQRIPSWRTDPLALRHAVGIPLDEIARAHARSKKALLRRIKRDSGARFDPRAFTVAFARRATGYKRATLLFHEAARLETLADNVGPLQIVLAGKAHPRDEEGKAIIAEVFRARSRLRDRVEIVYLEGYGMELGRLLCAGADLWLNTPIPPLEASGTSGMKAALNGVPSLSTLDGWWVEGCVPGVTGWAIGGDGRSARRVRDRDARDAQALGDVLEREVLPCFYGDPERYQAIRRSAIAFNASHFNTQRMVVEYLYEAWGGRP